MPTSSKPKMTIALLWIGIGVVTLFLAHVSLQAIPSEHFFLLESGAADITYEEKVDAQLTYDSFYSTAMAFLVAASMALAVFCKSNPLQTCKTLLDRIQPLLLKHKIGFAVYCIAGMIDMLSTMVFMRTSGIDLEVHPGIRLFAYCYGRLWGPMLGKSVQMILGFLIIAVRPRLTVIILWAASIFYSSAAIWNIYQYLKESSL